MTIYYLHCKDCGDTHSDDGATITCNSCGSSNTEIDIETKNLRNDEEILHEN